MKSLFVVCLIITIMTYSSLPALTSAATAKYDYSKSSDFSQGLEVGKLMTQINADPGIAQTLMGVNTKVDAVSILFDASLTEYEMIALNAVVSAHTPDTLLEQFCVTLPDADSTITSAMVQIGLLIANSTVAHTHKLISAARMILDGDYRGTFSLVNIGSAMATVSTTTGGINGGSVDIPNGLRNIPTGSMSIPAESSGRFMYAVTDDRLGHEMYMLVRVS